VASHEPLAAELDAFLEVARHGGRPAVDGEDGLWALQIASCLLQAAAEGHPVDLEDFGRLIPAQ
jgi:predicted dehydrogenase